MTATAVDAGQQFAPHTRHTTRAGKYLRLTATGVVKAGPGVLLGFRVASTNAGTLVLWDNASGANPPQDLGDDHARGRLERVPGAVRERPLGRHRRHGARRHLLLPVRRAVATKHAELLERLPTMDWSNPDSWREVLTAYGNAFIAECERAAALKARFAQLALSGDLDAIVKGIDELGGEFPELLLTGSRLGNHFAECREWLTMAAASRRPAEG